MSNQRQPDRLAPGQRWRRGGQWPITLVVGMPLPGCLWPLMAESEFERALLFHDGGIVSESFIRENMTYEGECEWFVAEMKKGKALL